MATHLPSFIFVGTAKAGTTSIYHVLKQHPQICIPAKETFFFLRKLYKNIQQPYPRQRSRDQVIIEEDIYDSLYASCGNQLAGEIGTGYLYHYDICIPEIINKLGKEVKILIILRNPVERTFSSYQHFLKDLHEQISFEESLDLEKQRIEEQWDFMWHHRSVGLYYEQVKAYIKAFKHVKILMFEELREDPQKVYRDICEFIGVDPEFSFDLNRKFNPSGKPRIAWIQRIITQENLVKKVFRPLFRLLYGKEKRSRIKKNLKSKNLKRLESMREESKRKLVEFFREDITQLGDLLGRDLSHWYR